MDINEAKPGHFCWYELATTDQDAAKRFYPALFGWTCEDFPMGPHGFYTTFKLRGRPVGAAYAMMPEQRAQGVPPNWLTYIAVTSADEAVAKAEKLGAKKLMGPLDVFEFGRMSVLHDPTGAVFAIWQSKKHNGVGVQAEPGAFCWSELATRDGAAATKFYTSLFGWETKVSDAAGFPYTHWRMGGLDFGGMMQMDEKWGQIPPHWMNYVCVANCDETVATATKLGGKVCVPPTDIPNTGRFSLLQDPQGAYISVIALTMMQKT
ncbi:MAG: VOC family protein [Gemmataceae bacterium]